MTEKKSLNFVKRLLALTLALVVFSGSSVSAAAREPAYNSKITKSNVLKLLDAYDSDGAYIVRSDPSNSVMSWFSGKSYIADGMDTAVHETFHEISVGGYGDNMYIGGRKFVFVPRTRVFYARTASRKIPKRLRTFRYETYMTDKVATNMHSDINGPYGMLNEMSAYSWGMNNSIKLYPYFKKYNRLTPFYSSCSNNKNAYAEFTYFILFYLDFAKSYDKGVYNGIMKNSQFRKVYKNTDKRFRNNIKKYDKIARGDRLFPYYAKASDNDYKILMREISKSKYQRIYNQLIR